MSQTLYRKYRSQRFADIVGQEHVTRILQNSIVRGRLNHAYLFGGPRGTGKTSVARIFAKALNCQSPLDGDACGVCEVCLAIAEGRAVDVIEIDAASNRGIDDVRELRDRVGYAPLQYKYKVYIIDEVHMITPQGFNALLKTLEEPPSHVVFCLCTTESHKLPLTILSRCIRFDFTRLPYAALAAHLEWIAGQEGFSLSTEAADRLARLAEGSARDAISLLDQLTVFCEREISVPAIEELFQLGDPRLAPATVDQLVAGDTAALLRVAEQVVAQGADVGRFMLKLGEELKRRYLDSGEARWREALDAVWQGVNLLKYESFPSLLLELTLLQASEHLAGRTPPGARAQTPAALTDNSTTEALRRPQEPQTAVRAPAPASSSSGAAQPAPVPSASRPAPAPEVKPPQAPGPTPAPATVPAAPVPSSGGSASASQRAVQDSASTAGDASAWETFLDELRKFRTTAYTFLLRGVDGEVTDGVLRLSFSKKARPAFGFAQSEENLKAYLELARRMYGKTTVLELRCEGESEVIRYGVTAAPEPSQTPEDEYVGDLELLEAPAEHGPGFDPVQLSGDSEDMSDELALPAENGAQAELSERTAPHERHAPSARDAMTLFDATEIEDDKD